MKNEELRKICYANYFIEKGKGKTPTTPVGVDALGDPLERCNQNPV